MQELYIIREVAGYKPWRYSSTIYTENKTLFEFLKNSKDRYVPDIEWWSYPGYDEEDEDFVYNVMHCSVERKYPFIVLDEVEVFIE